VKAVSSELVKYKLDLVGVQEVRRDEGGSEPADDTFFCGDGNTSHNFRTGLLVRHGITSAVKRAECVSDRLLYT